MIRIDSPLKLWVDLVQEAEKACGVKLAELEEGYLVFMLLRFMQRSNLKDVLVATSFLESILSDKKEKKMLTSDTADAALLFVGMYPEVARKRNVSIGYFLQMSRMSFFSLADFCDHQRHKGEAELYRGVAKEVPALARVLFTTRNIDREHFPIPTGEGFYELVIPTYN